MKNPGRLGPASQVNVSLSQLLLAPLNAIFKAQIHAARSFLNFILQIGYQPGGEDKNPEDQVYTQRFTYTEKVDGKLVAREIIVPTLSLVPVKPLAVNEASFHFSMEIEEIHQHQQTRKSAREEEKDVEKPWFLVDAPISLRGKVAPKTVEGSSKASIDIEVKIGSVEIPDGLDKLLTSLTQSTKISDKNTNQNT